MWAVASTENFVVVGGNNGGVAIVNRKDWEPTTGQALMPHTATIYRLVSIGGDRVVTAANDNKLALIDVARRQVLKMLAGHSDGVIGLDRGLASERLLFSGALNGSVIV